jgi:hypothetical protein
VSVRSERWEGVIEGTNEGTFVLELHVDGSDLRTTVVLSDRNLGESEFEGWGRRDGNRLVVDLNPRTIPSGSTLLGPIRVEASIHQDVLSGTWQSTIGTHGTLTATRSEAAVSLGAGPATIADRESVMHMPNWVALMGRYRIQGNELIFLGGTSDLEGRQGPEIGNFISDHVFGGGEISCRIRFQDPVENAAAGIILYYHPPTGGFVAATLGMAGSLCALSTWGGQQWTHHAGKGHASQLEPDVDYELCIKVAGSRISLRLNRVQVLTTDLPFPLPRGQAGLWALGHRDINFSRFHVSPESPSAFVVMQFSPPFNEPHSEVIVPVCTDQRLRVIRADDTFGPGIIIADIARQISEARVVIADIIPDNPNVFWELGYAQALNKPAVLIAERGRQLPFDVSPFRALFYENTIAEKRAIEEGLRRHLVAIQQMWSIA